MRPDDPVFIRPVTPALAKAMTQHLAHSMTPKQMMTRFIHASWFYWVFGATMILQGIRETPDAGDCCPRCGEDYGIDEDVEGMLQSDGRCSACGNLPFDDDYKVNYDTDREGAD